MAVKTSNKADVSTVKDFKYFTGVIPFKVVAVNPDLAELKSIGVDYMTKEPEYKTVADFGQGPVTNTVVDFWLQSIPLPEYPELDILTNVRFRINHEVFVGQTSGKTQFINKYGRTAWAMQEAGVASDALAGLNSNKWFKNEGARPAHMGEEDLHKFLFAWLNMTYDDKQGIWDDCLVNVDKLVAGDFSELKNIAKGYKEYTVKALAGINVVEKEGKIRYYYNVYSQMFLKHNQSSTNRLQEYISKDEYNEFKADVYTFDIVEFNKSAKPDAEKEEPAETTGNVF